MRTEKQKSSFSLSPSPPISYFLSLCNYLTLKFSIYSRFPTVKPIAVHITTREKFVSAEKRYDVECKSSGSRPEAVLTWWKGSRQIKRMAKNVSIYTSPCKNVIRSAASIISAQKAFERRKRKMFAVILMMFI